jgi:hypothetical protein
MLALRLGIDQRFAQVAGIGDGPIADVKDDGAGLEPCSAARPPPFREAIESGVGYRVSFLLTKVSVSVTPPSSLQ